MAGTLTISTLSDGTNSTSATNPIRGSAKAWANWGWVSSAVTVRSSYNVSSVTRPSSQNYIVNFTSAMANANYCAIGNGGTMGNGDIQSFATGDYATTSVTVKGTKQVGQPGEDVTIYNVIVMA